MPPSWSMSRLTVGRTGQQIDRVTPSSRAGLFRELGSKSIVADECGAWSPRRGYQSGTHLEPLTLSGGGIRIPILKLQLPVFPGKSDADAKAIADYFKAHPEEYRQSRNACTTLERAYLQSTPMGSFAINIQQLEGRSGHLGRLCRYLQRPQQEVRRPRQEGARHNRLEFLGEAELDELASGFGHRNVAGRKVEGVTGPVDLLMVR